MRRISLWSNVSFRLILTLMGLFYLAFLVLGSFIYFRTSVYLEREVYGLVDSVLNDAVVFVLEEAGLPELIEEINERVEADPYGVSRYILLDPNCTAIAGSVHIPRTVQRVQQACQDKMPESDWLSFTESSFDQEEHPGMAFVGRLINTESGHRMFYAHSVEQTRETRVLLARTYFWGFLILLILGGSAGFIVARVVNNRLEVINQASRYIREGQLSERIPVGHASDEFGRLAVNFNEMMDQIQQLMESVQSVSNSIAHDLRTPLTRLRNHLEELRSRCAEDTGAAERIDQAVGEADQLLATFSALLRIVQLESGGTQREFTTVDIAQVAEDVVELYEPLAEERGQDLLIRQASGGSLLADRELLFQSICNLVENAIRHAPGGSLIEVSSYRDDERVKIEVADNGEGIPAEFIDKVTERFYRRESHRGSTGNGLGLSLVAAVAHWHHGDLLLEDNDPGLRAIISLRPDPNKGQNAAP